tara:strand:- start:2445 stop:2669 length:225 start_codon:yes stop_codon:yes gene_type:complete
MIESHDVVQILKKSRDKRNRDAERQRIFENFFKRLNKRGITLKQIFLEDRDADEDIRQVAIETKNEMHNEHNIR